jgi:hypothetical protein
LRDGRIAPLVPDDVDYAAADIAAAALSGDVIGAASASETIAIADATRPEGATGLAPVAEDLFHAVAHPGRAYRGASEELLLRDDLDAALRERIERALDDDPLVRAQARVHDARVISFARAFNAFVEPIGQSILNVALTPYRLGRSLVIYGLELYREDPLPLERRQALAHWKEFLERYPEAPESGEVAERAEKAQGRWHRTQRNHALAQAKGALDARHPREALVLADRALRHSPEDASAERVRAEAERQLLTQRAERQRSVGFALPEDRELVPEGTRELSVALLAGEPPPPAALEDGAPFQAEARFAEAGWLLNAGREDAGWETFGVVADGDADTENMVRHAQAALADPVRNAYDVFEKARWRDRRTRSLWLVIGPFADKPTPSGADGVLETLMELPRMVQVAFTLPLRILQLPAMGPPKTAKTTAVEARRYLRLYPEGAHADEVSGWLEDYEWDRNNHLGALHIAEARDPQEDHAELREMAARQTLRVALKEQRSDLRRALLTGVTRRFPDTEAGDEAGHYVRDELETFTPHRISISRGFLEENPEVVGVHGLDLDPALLDGEASNGELHPDGLALIGGRAVEIAYVGADGDEEDPPETRYTQLSEEHLARLVARLEETSFENALLDDEDPVLPDAHRDLVFERARLGLADDVDRRATARAGFTYTGIRERYGVVRRREPLLPFDIVVRGSLADLSLGAFPRMRRPDRSEDALLYE